MINSRTLMAPVLGILLGSLVAVGSANAAIVDFSGHNMGTVAVGQSGTILNNPTGIPSLGTEGYGEVFGYLPSDTEITFSYSLISTSARHASPALGSGSELYATTNYDYTKKKVEYFGSSTAETKGKHSSTGHTFSKGTLKSSTPLVLASAHITDTAHGTTTIVNDSASSAYFLSALVSLEKLYGKVVVTYSVSAVPLPATALLFAFAMVAMGGMAYRQKARA